MSRPNEVRKTIKGLIQLLAAIFLLGLLLEIGFPFALVLMTYAMGLALAGPSRWHKWSIVFAIVTALIPAAAIYLWPKLPQDGILIGIIMFGLAPLLPAFYLWLAHQLRRTGEA